MPVFDVTIQQTMIANEHPSILEKQNPAGLIYELNLVFWGLC